MILSGANDKLQVVTAQATAVKCWVSWAEADTSTPPVVQSVDRTDTASITGAATTDILTCSASRKRRVKEASIFNDHASLSNAITVQLTDGTNVAPKWKGTLLAQESVNWTEGRGWVHVDAAGNDYAPVVQSALRVRNLPGDVANSTTTAASLPGLSIPLEPGSYAFEARIRHNTAATTTGIGFSANFTGTQTAFMYWIEAVTALATAADGNQSQSVSAAPGGLIEAEAARTVSTAGLTPKLSADNVGDSMTIIRGMATVTVAGLLEFYFKSEVAASAVTVKADSIAWAIKGR